MLAQSTSDWLLQFKITDVNISFSKPKTQTLIRIDDVKWIWELYASSNRLMENTP